MYDNKKAFPIQTKIGYNGGMDLEDYFAAKAMQGFITLDADNNCTYEEIAKKSYKQAEAMIKVRRDNK